MKIIMKEGEDENYSGNGNRGRCKEDEENRRKEKSKKNIITDKEKNEKMNESIQAIRCEDKHKTPHARTQLLG